ncbi:hypothetical protein LUZ60_013863 [Juncus effusus]|nr:hypothetical protein LUZ60_013863 [Juncus effusus]
MQSSLIGLRRVFNRHHTIRNSIYHAIARVSSDSSSEEEKEKETVHPFNWKERKNDELDKAEKISRKTESSSVRSGSDLSELRSKARSWFLQSAGTVLKWLSDAIKEQEPSDMQRIPMSGPFGKKVSRVLGGGLKPGSLFLVGGIPGVGKSTLALQIGHVTKKGAIAGPHTIEHIADVVLHLEIDQGYSAYRFLRPVKNRFGSTDELGIFEMSKTGLQVAAMDHTEMFLRDHDSRARVFVGHAVGVMHDGHRTFPVEIQALCISSPLSKNKVFGHGWILLNVLNGVKLSDTAGDLAIAAAVCSSYFECPIPIGIAFIGEVGLDGKLRTVPRINKRVKDVADVGYKKCIVPKGSEKLLADLDLDIEIVYCKNLTEMIEIVFTPK